MLFANAVAKSFLWALRHSSSHKSEEFLKIIKFYGDQPQFRWSVKRRLADSEQGLFTSPIKEREIFLKGLRAGLWGMRDASELHARRSYIHSEAGENYSGIKRAKCDWLCCIPRVNAARKNMAGSRTRIYIHKTHIILYICAFIFNSSKIHGQEMRRGGGGELPELRPKHTRWISTRFNLQRTHSSKKFTRRIASWSINNKIFRESSAVDGIDCMRLTTPIGYSYRPWWKICAQNKARTLPVIASQSDTLWCLCHPPPQLFIKYITVIDGIAVEFGRGGGKVTFRRVGQILKVTRQIVFIVRQNLMTTSYNNANQCI